VHTCSTEAHCLGSGAFIRAQAGAVSRKAGLQRIAGAGPFREAVRVKSKDRRRCRLERAACHDGQGLVTMDIDTATSHGRSRTVPGGVQHGALGHGVGETLPGVSRVAHVQRCLTGVR